MAAVAFPTVMVVPRWFTVEGFTGAVTLMLPLPVCWVVGLIVSQFPSLGFVGVHTQLGLLAVTWIAPDPPAPGSVTL